MKIVPPMVGVPRFSPWLGFSIASGVRMTCPQPHLRNSRRKTGVRKSVNASEIAAAIRSDLTRTSLPDDRRGAAGPPSWRT